MAPPLFLYITILEKNFKALIQFWTKAIFL